MNASAWARRRCSFSRDARAWEARETPLLARGEVARLEEEDLSAITTGPTLPLAAVWLLDASRRNADEIALESTVGAEGLGLLLEQSFGETGAPDVWRRIFEASVSLVEAVPIFRASVPGTLARLEEAARCYRAIVAS